ncbi:MAG: serine hydrolase domain-containing protein [Anaerolineae bacterium]
MAENHSHIHGSVAPGFEKVRDQFIRNFSERNELGAACAIYHKGEKVVDLWGGYRDQSTKGLWEEDTCVLVFSTTKGMASMAVAHANSHGLFDYDDRVAQHWPEFAQNGKEAITIRQLFSHQAGVCAIDEPLDLAALGDPDQVSRAIAMQKPAWEPGQKHGYHGITLGWYESELLRRVDPQKRTIGRYFQDEIAKPLGIDFYIGLPSDIPRSRIAVLDAYAPWQMLFHLNKLPWPFVKNFLNPKSITSRSFANPKVLGLPRRYNDVEMQSIELPASNGIGEVRGIAKAYGEFATGGKNLGLTAETLQALTQPAAPPSGGSMDEVLHINSSFSLGYLKPSADIHFGSSTNSFGTPGAGGSFGFADPDAEIGYAYGMNRMGFHLIVDPREEALRSALYDCLGIEQI